MRGKKIEIGWELKQIWSNIVKYGQIGHENTTETK